MKTKTKVIILLVASALYVALAHLLDGPLLEHLRLDEIYSDDATRALRVLGYVPVWIVVGIIMILIDFGRRNELPPRLRDAWARGVLLILSSISAGLVAELLKLLIRRERPAETFDGYVFRPLAEQPFNTSGLGMPSSHTAVAAGALTLLACLYPRASVVFALGALGCAWTRVAAGAHFHSDVALGIVVGVACALCWWTLHTRNLKRDAPQEIDA